jgi:hypothetical protein
MVTGMNTDVRHGDSVLHVQTEDLGGEPATIQTLVYHAGRILESIRRSYPQLSAGQDEEISKQLLNQHRTTIQAIIRGRIAVDAVITSPPEQPALVVSPLEMPRVGRPVSLLILLRGARSFKPLADKNIRIRFLNHAGEEIDLYAGRTDGKGFHLAEVQVPESPGTDMSLILTAGFGDLAASAALPVAPSHEAWLEEAEPRPASEPIDLVVSDVEPVMAGHDANLMILARGTRTCRPISGAEIRILYSEEVDDFQLIHQGVTDDRGIGLAGPTIPLAKAGKAMLTIEVRSGPATAEVVLPVFIPKP